MTVNDVRHNRIVTNTVLDYAGSGGYDRGPDQAHASDRQVPDTPSQARGDEHPYYVYIYENVINLHRFLFNT